MKKTTYYVLLFYFLLALFFWGIPCGFNFINKLNISGDPAFYLWSLKWWPYAISHGLNPFLTKAFWAPFGQNLAWTTSCPSIAISMWPITEYFGPVFSYNLVTIISLALAPFGIYLINKQLGLKESSSIFGGIIFFLSSSVWCQLLGHLNLDIIFMVIYLVYLYVLRFKSVIGKKLYISLFALLLAFQFGISNEIYATFVVFSAVAFIVLFLFYYKDLVHRKAIIMLGLETTISISASVVLLLPYLYYIFYGYIAEPIQNISILVADPLNYLMPTPMTWLFGNLFLPISSKFAGNFSEEGAYLGLPLIFILVSFGYLAVKNFYKENKLFLFIFILLIICIILSFGPYLRILNHQILPMPWLPFTKMPFIKQALPIRFPLYVDLMASLIAAIWFERFKYKTAKYVISIAAIIFLMPNLNLYKTHNINTYIPAFISSGEYKSYIKKDDNVIILPTNNQDGFQAPIWQYQTDFYFNASQLYAGPAPKQVQSILGAFCPSGLDTKQNLYPLAIYLEKCNVRYLIIDKNQKNLENKLDKYMPLNSRITTGGVILYKIDSKVINKLKELGYEHSLKIFSALYNVSGKFIKNGNSISNLYPKYLEEHGYLDKTFGYQTGPANNWTKSGGWIGSLPCPDGKGKCFGIGLVDNIYDLNPIINKYKSQALQIFFPYPKIYSKDSKETSGQLLMIFRAPMQKITSLPFAIDFTSNGNAGQFEQGGFCSPEPWGTWSCAKEISLSFDLTSYTKKPIYLTLEFNALVSEAHPQTFSFFLNGHLLAKKTFTANSQNRLSFDISDYIEAHNTLKIEIPDAATPKSIGINSDTRELGIGLIKAEISDKK